MKCELRNDLSRTEDAKMVFLHGFGKKFIMQRYVYRTKATEGVLDV